MADESGNSDKVKNFIAQVRTEIENLRGQTPAPGQTLDYSGLESALGSLDDETNPPAPPTSGPSASAPVDGPAPAPVADEPRPVPLGTGSTNPTTAEGVSSPAAVVSEPSSDESAPASETGSGSTSGA